MSCYITKDGRIKKIIPMCDGCEDKLFSGIECKGCRCICHKQQDLEEVGN